MHQGTNAVSPHQVVDAAGKLGKQMAWRAGIDADRRKRRRTPGDQRETLRRLTVTVAVAAAGLNAVLFAQTGIGQVGPGAFENAIVSFINAFVPGAPLQPPAQAPSPGPGASPVVTTGGS
jgi:hypothetical protein